MKGLKKSGYLNLIIFCMILFANCSTSKKNVITAADTNRNVLSAILNRYPAYFDSIVKRKDELNVQIIYTQIDRKQNGKPQFRDFYFNVNDSNYFYPASTVKFPVALLALQKLNELAKQNKPLNKESSMITEKDGDGQTVVYNDPTTSDGRPTVAHYIKKILLVSDNDAFNRLYEFLGQDYINTSLHKMGYKDAQIIHRLSISLNEQQNRHTNPVSFYDNNGKIIYEKPAERSELLYALRNTKLGKGYMSGNTVVNEPFDFSKKNRLSLSDLHYIMRSVIFPQNMPRHKRFDLTASDYTFLHKYMSMFPRESDFPFYDSSEYSDTYVKHFMYGNDNTQMQPGLRIFNKTGTAYGFLIDVSYIVDFNTGVEFMLTAAISCNSDGIYNDDKYDYVATGYPFFKNLGRVIYDYELKREKKYKADLSSMRFDY